MSFRLSLLSRAGTLPTIQDSITAFSASLREKDFSPDDEMDSLNNSRRANLRLNKFKSLRSLGESSTGSVMKSRRSFPPSSRDVDESGRTTLLEELNQTSEVSLEVTHGHQINARKIFVREARKSRLSTFETPKFHTDLRKLLATEKYESRRGLFSSTQSDLTDTSSNKKVAKKVKFIDVTIREYPIIVGDNPAGSGGPPLTIDWHHVTSVDVDIDMYEKVRAGHRRKQEEMKMNKDHRQKLLRSLGFTMVEMQKGTKAANIVRNRRRHVNAELYRDSSNENIERVMRRLFTIVTFGYNKRKEEKYLRRSLQNYKTNNKGLKSAFMKEGSIASTARGSCAV